MTYAIYLRKSRADYEAEERGEGETLARHEQALLNLAHKMDYSIAQIYREIVSGESIANRPQMKQLLSDVAARKYAGVLVMEIERLARGDTYDQATVAQTFKFSDTLIVTPMKTYDPQNSMDEEYFEFSLFMSRREYKTITRRMQTGRKMAAAEGHYIASRPPYGYDRVKLKTGEWTLSINEEQAGIVRQIFDWYIAGEGGLRIATRLNQMGLASPYGTTWCQTTVNNMIHNPVYIGRITWDKRVDTIIGLGDDGEKIHKRIHNKKATNVQGIHTPIIDEHTFALANSALRVNKPPVRAGQTLSNPLAGLVKCGICGATMKGMPARAKSGSDERYPYRLKCPRTGCATIGVSLDILESAILETVNMWKVAHIGESPKVKTNENDLELLRLKKQLSQFKAQKNKLCEFLERGIYDEETFQMRTVALAESMSAAESRIVELQQTVGKPDIEDCIRAIAPSIDTILDAYARAEGADEKNSILRDVLDHVDYFKTKRCNKAENAATHVKIVAYPIATS